MRDLFFLIILIFLFLGGSFWLTFQQEKLFQKANQDLVTANFLNPESNSDFQFAVAHKARQARELTIVYEYADNPSDEIKITLAPNEKKLFTPEINPESIKINYQNSVGQNETLILYKK